jgi:PAS domain S-box-containing protein
MTIGKAIHILIIEDNPDDAELIRRELKKTGIPCEIRWADSKEAFLKELEAFNPDVILCDYKMPDLGAPEALEVVKGRSQVIPFIVVSGTIGEDVAVDMLKTGATDYIMKDNLGKLGSAVNRALEEARERAERKKAEVALLQEKERAQKYFDNAAVIMLVIDVEGIVSQINEKGCEVLGYNKEEIVGKDWCENFIPKVICREIRSELKRMANGEEGLFGYYENDVVAKSGEKRLIAWRNAILKDNAGKVVSVVCSGEDITERKEAEEKLNQALKEEVRSREILTSMLDDNNKVREELEKKLKELKETQNMLIQSEKLASLGTMVSAMAHEVNNPLMIISGNAQLCLEEDIKSESVKENIRTIIDQCNRAKDVMQRLLIFSKPSIGEVMSVDINGAVEFAVKLVEHQYSLRNISIIKSYGHDLPRIELDEKRIHEVVVNLLKNAAEAMPGGGVITIVTSQESRSLRIDITDTGGGMSEEAVRKLFVPFFTTKEKGTGLGLPVCYGIIKAHSGELKFNSEVGKGTTATILLPLGGGN